MTAAVLFVSNGHGEAAIANRIAAELRLLGDFRTDHFPLVGTDHGHLPFAEVGPRAALPSGGLVAMGNVAALWSDLRAGFARLAARQLQFMRGAHDRYAAVVPVGDIYALLFALLARRPLAFVGTAKSVYVAPYGPVERRLLRRARRVFVRDPATAADLVARGVAAEAPGNVITDLLATTQLAPWPVEATERIALLPGSRGGAYTDAVRLAGVARAVMRRCPGTAAVMSIAAGLDPARFTDALDGEPAVAGWSGELGGLLADATLAIGQAGTANEAAAACGIPIVALADRGRTTPWYRMRQIRLLGAALAIAPADVEPAAQAVAALIADAPRRARMAAAGRERMGGRGGAAAIARAVAALTLAR